MDVPFRRRPKPQPSVRQPGEQQAARRPHLDPALTEDPLFAVPPEILARYNARVLDPTTATRVAGQAPVRSTVYVADTLMISPKAEFALGDRLTDVAADLGLSIVPPIGHLERRAELVQLARDVGHPEPEVLFPSMVRLEPSANKSVRVDAWDVLQAYRGSVASDRTAVSNVALNHLLTAASGPSIGGSPYVMGHGIGGSPYVMGHGIGGAPYVMGHGIGVCEYGVAGWGGRQPVIGLAKPVRSDFGSRRRPVVAVLDTGLGSHPWFDATSVAKVESSVLSVPVVSPETTGVTLYPASGTLDPDAGHGTFIAGLIHQQCPDADILMIPIMGGDGVVAEDNLLAALSMLALRQRNAIASGDASQLIDVLSLSLGYYHESPVDASYDPRLLAPIQELGSLGVVTVVAAGNDCTNRPMFPAAFAPWVNGEVPSTDPGCLPVISVGALNPNSTVAMFSNQGDWVTCNRPGAAVVSSYPVTINAASQPSEALRLSGTLTRSTIDPDDFASGFAVWSGTSFAGPVLAGELAAELCAGELSSCDATAAVTRGWKAVTTCIPELTP